MGDNLFLLLIDFFFEIFHLLNSLFQLFFVKNNR